MNKMIFAAAALVALASCSVKAPMGTALFDFYSYEGCDDFYAQNPLPGEDYYYNPVIEGWYSDPAICSNGKGDYFLATSSFVYFPGVPILHSTDLMNWEPVGNVLTRESQLPYLDGQRVSSGGIYAPDIKYCAANETYYMVTTDVGGGNFYVKTKDPWGEWSDPVYLPEVKGIDPSIFFDEDGRAYIVNCDDAPEQPEYNGHRSIRCIELDLENDCTIGERVVIVNKGSRPELNPYWIEGPHMYKINGTYYLMCAEGGTYPTEHHSEVVFKGESPFGPFVAYEGNPILTQVGLDPAREYPVTCAGHADLVQAANGSWWAVFLATRPFEGDFENLGRETFMLPVEWTEDGWPVILKSGESVPLIVKMDGVKRGENPTFGNFSFKDDFDSEALDSRWMLLRGPSAENYSLTEFPGYLKLNCSEDKASEMHSPSLALSRMYNHKFVATTRMYFTPSYDSADEAGLLLFKDERHQYFFKSDGSNVSVERIETKVTFVSGRRPSFEEVAETLASAELPSHKYIDFKVVSNADTYEFWYAVDGGEWIKLVDGVDAKFLTSVSVGGFTGTVIGPYAVKK